MDYPLTEELGDERVNVKEPVSKVPSKLPTNAGEGTAFTSSKQ